MGRRAAPQEAGLLPVFLSLAFSYQLSAGEELRKAAEFEKIDLEQSRLITARLCFYPKLMADS